MVSLRFIRDEPPLDRSVEVIRGGLLDPRTLRLNADANFKLFGFYGLSVYCVRAPWTRGQVMSHHLRRFSLVSILEVGDLEDLGLQVLLTGREPHGDVVGILTTGRLGGTPGEPGALVATAVKARHHVVVNPYHGEEDPRI